MFLSFFFMSLAIYSNEAFCFILDYANFLCSWIVGFVFFGLFFQVWVDCGVSQAFHESCVVELLWTFFPMAAVVGLCGCSVACSLDLGFSFPGMPEELISVTGHQWYWEVDQGFSISDFEQPTPHRLHFDMFMSDFVSSVDHPIMIRPGKMYRLLVTSADVIHSFSCGSLGLKVDACAGRLNSVLLLSEFVGSHVGYCTELCGAGHAYMPIVFECSSYLLPFFSAGRVNNGFFSGFDSFFSYFGLS